MKSASERWSRVFITSVSPRVLEGDWPIKRTVGEPVHVVAGIIVDGHDQLCAGLYVTRLGGATEEVKMTPMHNDEYTGTFIADSLGLYTYHVRAWINRYGSWHEQYERRFEAKMPASELKIELLDGAALLKEYAVNAPQEQRKKLLAFAERYVNGDIEAPLDEESLQLALSNDPQKGAVQSNPLTVEVDRKLAAFAAWYEFFPRSTSQVQGIHGTFDDAALRLERIRDLGFDIVYLPPIHPIGTTFRKGKDNHPKAKSNEPGSPWAIGSPYGGHTSVHKDLGGLPAFDRFMKTADANGLEVALDIAFQCSPDHPWIKQHPEWFKKRADGSIRSAENPPKKYQDVYPLDFECADWRELWEALKNVFEFWIQRGVLIFRVDNPHTKPMAFWTWCLSRLRVKHPEVIFLAEAFTRPKSMYTLAKLGFNNSYTYFTWRNTKEEITDYLTELTSTNIAEYFRPSFWPNTPDILHEYLTSGGRAAHIIRYILAATLSPIYGIYGPPYEHVIANQHPDREEYADNEKYEIRNWNWNDPESLQGLFQTVNQIRKENIAFQEFRNLKFLKIENPLMLAYSKHSDSNSIVCIVSLDPFQEQKGEIEIPLEALNLPQNSPFQMLNLLKGERYIWQGRFHMIHLNPHSMPARIFQVMPRVRTEADFDYFV
ncbi:MAG: alpha-1,4-glucan--maltose-1-phosphate maltosyltransferase [Bacteroidetes bacterium]|nr:alpha-1,4-glucan--maltose-1-phosphate maltosyltransferase [Bacteroidota bacterium]